ncbi:hypothetical protein [Halorientalis halophila]|uniref:hypothetical protein n=1 Tax=Halorientalis halophila TaxID=3108499 RepID=UPI0030089070
MSPVPRPLVLLRRYALVLELAGTATALLALWNFTALLALWNFTARSKDALLGAGVGITAATVWPYVRRRYGVNRGWGKLPVGLALAGLGVFTFTFADGAILLQLAFVLVGGWLALDGAYDLRSGAGRTRRGEPGPMDRFGDAAIVGQALEDGPRAAAELEAEVDLPRSRIDEALDTLQEANVVEKRGDQYEATHEDRRITDALRDVPGRTRERVDGVLGRIRRPFRLFG